jgi:hypothetical protein
MFDLNKDHRVVRVLANGSTQGHPPVGPQSRQSHSKKNAVVNRTEKDGLRNKL